jgi:hypothetical protein
MRCINNCFVCDLHPIPDWQYNDLMRVVYGETHNGREAN